MLQSLKTEKASKEAESEHTERTTASPSPAEIAPGATLSSSNISEQMSLECIPSTSKIETSANESEAMDCTTNGAESNTVTKAFQPDVLSDEHGVTNNVKPTIIKVFPLLIAYNGISQ